MQLTTRWIARAAAVVLSVAGMGLASAADPPGRVARLSYTEGNVSFTPAGEGQWLRAMLNRPQIPGDRLWTDNRSRAELQLGGAALRMDAYTNVQILALDDRIVQIELTQGVVNLRVRRVYPDQSYEIDTPTLAFVVTQPGSYRVEVDGEGRATTVVVWYGDAVAYGDNGRFDLREGDAIRFYEPSLRDYEELGYPRPDGFDRFVDSRDAAFDRSASLRYVPDDLIGYNDLDAYGSWGNTPDYGAVWYPSSVGADWAPYRDGRWIWQDPWGWTWVDNSPWGFAPYHYGRWVQLNRRWGWIPCERRARPVYAPALVAFVGGDGWALGINTGVRPVGWFPLGPRDVYVPSYGYSRDYFTRVNVYNRTVINNTTVVNVYNDYASGQPRHRQQYMHGNSPYAITAVSQDTFTRGREVGRARLQVDREGSARAQALHMAAFAPSASSVTGSAPAATSRPQRNVMERRVIARNAPPPTPASFENRREMYQSNPGRGVTPEEMGRGRGRGQSAAVEQQRVQVVGQPSREIDRAAGGRDRTRDAAGQAERYTYPQDQRGGRGPQPAGQDAIEREQAERYGRGRDARGQVQDFDRQQHDAQGQQRAQEEASRRGERDRQVEQQRDADDSARRQAQQFERDQQRQAEQNERQRQQAERDQQVQSERYQRDLEQAQRGQQQQQQRQREQAGREQQRDQAEQDEQRQRQRQQQEQQAQQYERQSQQQEQQAERQREQAERAQRQQAEQYERQRQQQEQQQAEQQERQRQQQEQQSQQAERKEERGRGRSRDKDGDDQPDRRR